MSVPPSEPKPSWGAVLGGFVDARLVTMFALGLAVGVPRSSGWWSVYGTLAADEFGKRRLAEIVPALAFGSLALWMIAALLMAPLVDLVRPPLARRLGRRRGWLVTLMAAAMALVVGLMVLVELRGSPVAGAGRVAAGVVALLVCGALVSAGDGYRLERMPMRAQGLALTAHMLGAAVSAAILLTVMTRGVPPLAGVAAARHGAARAMVPFAAASALVIVAAEAIGRSGGGDAIFPAARAIAIGIATGAYIAALALIARFTARRFAASQWAAFMACASALSLSGDGARAAMAAIGRLPFTLIAQAMCLLALFLLPHLACHLDATDRNPPR